MKLYDLSIQGYPSKALLILFVQTIYVYCDSFHFKREKYVATCIFQGLCNIFVYTVLIKSITILLY